MRADPHLCFLLHRRKYRETSAIVDLLSSQYGIVRGVVKGVYRKKRPGGDFSLFSPYEAAWIGSGELHTITHLETVGNVQLSGQYLYSGFYVNELVMRMLRPADPNPELFETYVTTISALAAQAPLENSLRQFELALLDACGYGLNLQVEAHSGDDISADSHYHYEIERGPVATATTDGAIESPIGSISGKTLLYLARRKPLDEQGSKEAKRLLRTVIQHYIGDKPLASRSLFRSD